MIIMLGEWKSLLFGLVVVTSPLTTRWMTPIECSGQSLAPVLRLETVTPQAFHWPLHESVKLPFSTTAAAAVVVVLERQDPPPPSTDKIIIIISSRLLWRVMLVVVVVLVMATVTL